MAVTVDQFTQQLIASSLMSATDVNDLLAALPPGQTPRDGEQLARLLVSQRKLTPFQAQYLYKGKGKSLVLGNYVVVDKLGQGGMGVVFKAEHRRMKRLVALKVLSPALTKTPEVLRRFQREVEAAAKLEHPNVVTAYDADEALGTHFLVSQFIEGIDLAELVRRQKALTPERAVGLILQAARGLEYAHAHGVIHRDIKPSNLLIDQQGTVKILDLGLARLDSAGVQQDQLTGTGQIMGTVDYMAPEQAMDTRSADGRADIYSLGITLWYLLSGRPVFDGETMMAKLLAHRERAIPSLKEVCPQASPELDATFTRMVAKTPAARFQSMADVITALEQCLAGGGVTELQNATFIGEDARFKEFVRDMEASKGATSGSGVDVRQPTVSSSLDEATVTVISSEIGTDPQTQNSLNITLSTSRPEQISRRTASINSRKIWIAGSIVAGMISAVFLLLVIPKSKQRYSGAASAKPVREQAGLANAPRVAEAQRNTSQKQEVSPPIPARAKSTVKYLSDIWINVTLFINPELDKIDVPGLTGANAWRVEDGELWVGQVDQKPSKLVFPLDLNGPSFECEIEFTRLSGTRGFNLDVPVAKGPAPIIFDLSGDGRVLFGGAQATVPGLCRITTGQRSQLRVIARQQDSQVQIEIVFNGKSLGTWTGNREAMARAGQEGYPSDRRTGLWIHGDKYVFHKIILRMLDGGTAQSLHTPNDENLRKTNVALKSRDLGNAPAATPTNRLKGPTESKPQLNSNPRPVQFAPAVDFAAERKAAEWLNSIGGQFIMQSPQGRLLQLVDGKLPPEPFYIQSVTLSRNARLKDDGMANLTGCTRLAQLTLSSNENITDAVTTHLQQIPGLSDLRIYDCRQLTGAALRGLDQIVNLKDLGMSMADADVHWLAPPLKLRSLDASVTSLTNKGLEELARLQPNLERLTLDSRGKATLHSLANFPHLQSVMFGESLLTGETSQILSRLPNLVRVETWAPPVPGTFARLSAMKQLQSLRIYNSTPNEYPVTDADFDHLTQLRSLTYLQLEGISPSDTALRKFAEMASLRELFVVVMRPEFRTYTPAGVAKFRELRPDVRLMINGRYQPELEK